ncbi:DUF4190 domain-containing protein [Streptomyces sp. HMX87]|uniref:DUF4190 domain-containing protein n=1 Tax=Streptomyces sp. HMX87 TaxID=3390849 RepID=UPI003A83DC42
MTGYGSSSAASRSGTNGLAVASLVCGVIGVFVFSVILGPIAIVLGVLGLRQAPAKGGSGLAKAGVVLGVVALVLYAVLLAVGGFSWYVGG